MITSELTTNQATKKIPADVVSRDFTILKPALRSLDVGGLLSLRALNYFKSDFLTLFERLESAHVDC
jgi:hypothetical protein